MCDYLEIPMLIDVQVVNRAPKDETLKGKNLEEDAPELQTYE